LKTLSFRLVLVLVVVVTLEAGSLGALSYLGAKHYAYEIPRQTHGAAYEDRMRIADPLLGWPLQEGKDAPGGSYRDGMGARRIPAFPDPDASPACVSLYGDSFVESYVLDAEHAFANLLAQALGCRVANFGQAGYGTDQAYLRHQRNTADRAGVVVLAHMLEDIQRNVNRNRDLLSGGRDYLLKPRFVLAGGKLELVPMPVLTRQEYERNIGLLEPALRLEHESFQPDGDLLGPLPRFPYSVSLFRNLGNYGLRARIAGHHSRFAPLYQPGHPTQALELTFAILRAFRVETPLRGQRALVLLMPTREDLTYREKTGVWVHQPLLDLLRTEAIPYVDFGPYLEQHRDREMDAYFTPDGHYSERGDALLARMLAREIRF
jgi:hypothetical protein